MTNSNHIFFQGFFLRHPGLGVPICKDCHKFYFEGSWRKDDEGKFEYCGWCAQARTSLEMDATLHFYFIKLQLKGAYKA